MKKLILKLIIIYKKLRIFPSSPCRFSPACSEYTYRAVEKYGTINGLLKGIRRILKCHPWSAGGYDPVK